MTELIKITTNEDGSQVVSARELHKFLESRRDFSNWIKDRIEKYGFIENQDYQLLNNFGEQTGRGGHNKKEYALTLDTAKEISMVEGNEKGRQARRYFIECEKKLREVVSNQQLYIPKTLPEALRAYADEVEKNQLLEEKIKQDEPKVEYFDNLIERDLLTNFRDTAKELGLKQQEFIQILLDKSYIYRDKDGNLKPYSQYSDLFTLKEFINSHNGKAGLQTLITPKGRAVLLRIIKGVQERDLKYIKQLENHAKRN